MCQVQPYDESTLRFPCTLHVVHEVQDRSDIVDEVKITLPVSHHEVMERRCEATTESSLRGVLTAHDRQQCMIDNV